jgi:hypothetical protein
MSLLPDLTVFATSRAPTQKILGGDHKRSGEDEMSLRSNLTLRFNGDHICG